MRAAPKETLYDRLVRRLGNNRIIAVGLIVFAFLIAVGALTGALNSFMGVFRGASTRPLDRTSKGVL